MINKSARAPDANSPVVAKADDGGRHGRHHVEGGAEIGKSEMAGYNRPARNLQKVSRADRYERILNVVGGGGDAHACVEQLAHPREATRRQPLGFAALQKQIGGRQRDDGDARFGEASDDSRGLLGRRRTQRATMTGGHPPLHAMGARPLDDRVEQQSPAIEMLVDVHVERQSASLGELEQEIEKCERLIRILRNAADDVGAGGDRAVEPLSGGIELARRVRSSNALRLAK